jgi:hypothetical protein
MAARRACLERRTEDALRQLEELMNPNGVSEDHGLGLPPGGGLCA